MEKLYREIKCSDRLPKEGMEFFVTETNKYLLQTSGILEDGQWFDVRNGNEIDVDTWLEPIPSPEPSMNTDEIVQEKIIAILNEKLETASFPHLYISGKEETAKAIAQLFNQQPALTFPTEDEIDEMSLHYVKNLKGMSLGKSITARIDFIKGAKAIIELIKSKQL